MSIKKIDALVCDTCTHVIDDDVVRIECVIIEDKKVAYLHACDLECLSDLIDKHAQSRVILDNRSDIDKELKVKAK